MLISVGKGRGNGGGSGAGSVSAGDISVKILFVFILKASYLNNYNSFVVKTRSNYEFFKLYFRF